MWRTETPQKSMGWSRSERGQQVLHPAQLYLALWNPAPKWDNVNISLTSGWAQTPRQGCITSPGTQAHKIPDSGRIRIKVQREVMQSQYGTISAGSRHVSEDLCLYPMGWSSSSPSGKFSFIVAFLIGICQDKALVTSSIAHSALIMSDNVQQQTGFHTELTTN